MGNKGKGGSQLSQLKAKLQSEGVSDRRQMSKLSKKRKSGQAAKERQEQDARRQKLDEITASSSFNPFDVKITKPKNVVLGQQIRGATGRPGEARRSGLQERKDKLLPEYVNRNKSGSFVDRRFGEGDSLSVEDKMLERFTRERQRKASKMSMYNLDNGDEDVLTHFGQNLGALDNYDDIRLSEEEGEEDHLQRFGGFNDDDEDETDRTKSKAEVMKELIAKSKSYKLERQQQKNADEDLRQELDDNLADIRNLLTAPRQDHEHVGSQAQPKSIMNPEKMTNEERYDAAVREMVFDRRSRPQERLKTEEEKAQELAERLQEAERRRLKRMRGGSVGSEDDDENEAGQRKKGKRQTGGDDLDDDFDLDGLTTQEVYGLGPGLFTQRSVSSAGDDVKSDDEDDDVESVEDGSEESDNVDEFDDLSDPERAVSHGEEQTLGTEDGLKNLADVQVRTQAGDGRRKDLPFTFACPASLDDLLDILNDNNANFGDASIIVKRILALHHSSLAEINKVKLQRFTGVLLDYILHLSMQIKSGNKEEICTCLNALVSQIFQLTKSYPVASSEHFVNKLALMQRNLIRGLSKGASNPAAKTWPGLPECVFLKISGVIWPTSDRSHPVATPLALLIGQYLASCRIRNMRDVASGLYLCALVAEQQTQSKRIVPEALNFLHNALSVLTPLHSRKDLTQLNQEFGIPWPESGQIERQGINDSGRAPSNGAEEPMDLVASLVEDDDRQDNATFQAQALTKALALVDEFARMYVGSVAFQEMFGPFEVLIDSVIKPFGNDEYLETSRQALLKVLRRLIGNANLQRRALRLQAHRAVALSSHVPKFDQGFNPDRKSGRFFDPDAQRAELSKLRALEKKERKGAMRELRRDNEFLADVRRRERAEEDTRYAKTIDKIMGSLSAERGEEKRYLHEKQKLKKRAGKK